MSDLVKEITLTTGGFGTQGFSFWVLSNQEGHTEEGRLQLGDPHFDRDFNHQPFVAGIPYRFLGFHPLHMPDEELLRVVFKETGGYDVLDPKETTPTPGLAKITDLFSDKNSNDLDRDAVARAIVKSMAPETLALLAGYIVKAFKAADYETICAGLSEIGCSGGGGNPTTFDAGDIYFYEPIPIQGPDYDLSLESVTCYQITGWSANKNQPDVRTPCYVFINGINAGKTTITEGGRADVSQELKVTNTTGHFYGFKFTVPAEFRIGSKLTVELKPLSGTVAARNSPKTTTQNCLDTSNLLDVSIGKPFTTSNSEPGAQYDVNNLNDSYKDSIWTTTCLTENDQVTVTIDLQGTSPVQQIILAGRVDDQGALPVAYFFDGSLNNQDGWFRMATVNNQPRTAEDILLEVEKDLSGNYRDVRYLRMTTTKFGTAFADCMRVQLSAITVKGPTFTPSGSTTPITRQPKSLSIPGDFGQKEGTSTSQKVMLTYTNGDVEDVTAVATRGTGSDFSLNWSADGSLSAANNSTVGDSRSSTLTASYLGLTTSKTIQIYDSSVAVYVVSWRIDKREGPAFLQEGTSGTYRVVGTRNDSSEVQYTDSGSYSILTPYPNGMIVVTGMEAVATVTLPMNSITADLSRTLRFTFPAGGGFVEKVIDLKNVDTPVTFVRYEIDGETNNVEGASSDNVYKVVEVYSDGSRPVFTEQGGSFSLWQPYPPGVSLGTPAQTQASIHVPMNSVSGDVSGTLYYTFANGSVIEKGIVFKNVAATQPPGTESCSDYRHATEEELQSYSLLQIIEYYRNNIPRAFVSRAEAIQGIQERGKPYDPSFISNFDLQRCTSPTFEVGSRLYGNNNTLDNPVPHIYWPAEKGWWGVQVYVSSSVIEFYIIQTDACGFITSKERYS